MPISFDSIFPNNIIIYIPKSPSGHNSLHCGSILVDYGCQFSLYLSLSSMHESIFFGCFASSIPPCPWSTGQWTQKHGGDQHCQKIVVQQHNCGTTNPNCIHNARRHWGNRGDERPKWRKTEIIWFDAEPIIVNCYEVEEKGYENECKWRAKLAT